MTRMHHPLARAGSVAELEAYPWPDFEHLDFSYLKPRVDEIHADGLAVFRGGRTVIEPSPFGLTLLKAGARPGALKPAGVRRARSTKRTGCRRANAVSAATTPTR